MRQRVMIAMALAVDPEVVIMDEPTTALDIVVQREILAEIAELQRGLQFAVLFITHDLSLLLEIADRIAILYAGRLVEMGTAEEIHHRHRAPLHPRPARARSRAFTGPRRQLAGDPGIPARSARRCLPAVRSSHAAVFARHDCASVDMQLLPVPGRSAGAHHRLPVRPERASPSRSARGRRRFRSRSESSL